MTLSALRIRMPRFPVAVEFTREGTVFVLLSLAIGAAAVNTGNNVLYLIFSIMLGLIVVSGIISRRILIGLSLHLDFPDQLFPEAPNVCYVSILNSKKRIPSLALRFVARQPTFPAMSRHFFYVPPGKTVGGFAQVIFPRRGVYRLMEVELQTRVPFSFFVKIRRIFLDLKVRVYPRIYRFSEQVVNRFAEGIIIESPFRGESQQLLHLRDYNPFDSSRRIHWKASAKAEKLLVKEYQREQGQDIVLYFDCFPDRNTPDGAVVFEKAMSFLASIAHVLVEKNFRCKFLFPGKSFDLGPSSSLIPLFDYLAELELYSDGAQKYPETTVESKMILCLRSNFIPARMSQNLAGARNLFLEEWLPLMREDPLNSQWGSR